MGVKGSTKDCRRRGSETGIIVRKRRNSMRSNMSRDGPGKSIGTNQSADSGHSDPDTVDSPIKSVSSSRARKLDSSSIRNSSQKGKSTGKESKGSEDTSSDRK